MYTILGILVGMCGKKEERDCPSFCHNVDGVLGSGTRSDFFSVPYTVPYMF